MLENTPKGAMNKGDIRDDNTKKERTIKIKRMSAIVLPVDVAITYLLLSASKNRG